MAQYDAAYGDRSSWTATLDDGTLNRDSLCWIPDG
jgi:hypothetical protein